jgi:mRNA interferase MazF
MAGRHFALVLSSQSYNRLTRLCVACPVTGQVKGFPFEVALPPDLVLGDKGGGGCVLADQIKSLSWTDRGARFICEAPDGILPDVLAKIRALLQL